MNTKSRRMTEAQKRRRQWARQDGKLAAQTIARAISYQKDAAWFADRQQYADLAATFQRMSDQALAFAAQSATYAAHWANLSEKGGY